MTLLHPLRRTIGPGLAALILTTLGGTAAAQTRDIPLYCVASTDPVCLALARHLNLTVNVVAGHLLFTVTNPASTGGTVNAFYMGWQSGTDHGNTDGSINASASPEVSINSYIPWLGGNPYRVLPGQTGAYTGLVFGDGINAGESYSLMQMVYTGAGYGASDLLAWLSANRYAVGMTVQVPTGTGLSTYALSSVVPPIPEPGTLSLMLAGLGAMVGAGRWRRRDPD